MYDAYHALFTCAPTHADYSLCRGHSVGTDHGFGQRYGGTYVNTPMCDYIPPYCIRTGFVVFVLSTYYRVLAIISIPTRMGKRVSFARILKP